MGYLFFYNKFEKIAFVKYSNSLSLKSRFFTKRKAMQIQAIL
jgi:hypothetical protein